MQESILLTMVREKSVPQYQYFHSTDEIYKCIFSTEQLKLFHYYLSSGPDLLRKRYIIGYI